MPPTPHKPLPLLLFGYHSSPFTQKIRLSLRLKQPPDPYTFLTVPPMPPRPLLTGAFALPYRRVPVLAIGRDVYVDTTLITEALESRLPHARGTLFPPTPASGNGRRDERGLQRLWARTFADLALFRTATGLVPPRAWRGAFGADRGRLVGHPLSPAKLAAKVPRNVAALDTWLSVLEAQFAPADGDGDGDGGGRWLLGSRSAPGLADVALFYQLDWALRIAVGRGVRALTAGGAADAGTAEADAENARAGEWVGRVWRRERYPGLWGWFERFGAYVEALPLREVVVDEVSDEEKERVVVDALGGVEEVGLEESMVGYGELRGAPGPMDEVVGLRKGVEVVVAPEDTGKGDPTYGTLLASSPEEVVIKPRRLGDAPPLVDVRVHFPRMGFVIRPVNEAKL